MPGRSCADTRFAVILRPGQGGSEPLSLGNERRTAALQSGCYAQLIRRYEARYWRRLKSSMQRRSVTLLKKGSAC